MFLSAHWIISLFLWQTTPASTFAQLDKCLREALTLDGVLEFRHEKFWTLGVLEQPSRSLPVTKDSSGFLLTGSLHVRIRRDANEQLVLAHIREKLSPLVPLLTVQVRQLLLFCSFWMDTFMSLISFQFCRIEMKEEWTFLACWIGTQSATGKYPQLMSLVKLEWIAHWLCGDLWFSVCLRDGSELWMDFGNTSNWLDSLIFMQRLLTCFSSYEHSSRFSTKFIQIHM